MIRASCPLLSPQVSSPLSHCLPSVTLCVSGASRPNAPRNPPTQVSIKGFKDDTFNVLIATDVAGRGIDVPDVALVINYDMAHSIEAYTHRCAGLRALCVWVCVCVGVRVGVWWLGARTGGVHAGTPGRLGIGVEACMQHRRLLHRVSLRHAHKCIARTFLPSHALTLLPPPQPLAPHHRIGRTGRAGRKGTAITFLTGHDSEVFYDLKKLLEESKAAVPPELARSEAAKNKPGAPNQKRESVVYAKK